MRIKKTLNLILGLIRPVNKTVASITYTVPNNRLKGMNIIITGGGRGLGAAMAEKFVNEGANVLIAGRNENTSCDNESLGRCYGAFFCDSGTPCI